MLTSALLNTTPAQILAGTPTQSQAITCVHLCNITPDTSTAQTVAVTLYAVPVGGNLSNMQWYKIYNQVEITSTDTVMLDTEKLILANGDSLWASANVIDGISMTVSSIGI